MSLFRLLLLRSLNHHPPKHTALVPLSHFFHNVALNHVSENTIQDPPIPPPPPQRSYAFTSAEEAAAERRRRKRRLRIEPPIHALRASAPYAPPTRDPNAPRLPDSTSALVGHRLNLHNRVQSLIRASDLDAASLLARSSVFSSTRPTVFTCNAIIAAMYRNKRFNEAVALFHFFFKQSDLVPNVVSYNNLINTHCDMGEVDTAIQVYHEILENAPFNPSPMTYRHLTKGLVDAGRIEEAVDLLREMLNKGHGADSLVFNNLISGFLNLENLNKANELFDELKERCLVYDGVVNATFMEWWFNQGKDKEAMESYKSLLDRNFKMPPPTCNALLVVLLNHGKTKEALALFENMLDNHTPPNTQAVNSDTFSIMVNEYFKLRNFEEAIKTFRKVGKKLGSKPFAMDTAGYNNIISRLCEHGMLSEAENFFQELCGKSLTPDVPMYRTMIDAYLKAERVDDALRSFTNMVESGLRVVASFGTRVFSEFLKNGKNIEAAALLTKMGEKDPKPDASIYDVVVRGLCNAGELDKSLDILDQMMKYSIGVTPALREFVRGAFGKVGRNEDMGRVLNESRWRFTGRQPRSFGQSPRSPSRPAEMGGWQPSVSPQMGGGHQYSGSSQMGGGHQYSGSPQIGGGHQHSGSPQMGGGHQHSGSPQMGGGHQYSGYPQMGGGQQYSGSPQMGGGQQ
ncbi:pentatricopeptide repeat-containing protein At1g10270-like isoform X2 [Hibiscus syriacus]|uniref:pentatricopeptide repeat-containing protein At1g10270-like isoform X2 n=1 Tax=Hibiscus syriacus TaxID=106335 RepID=UPI001921EA02|nr:pentatricopeptide repeat-containing protein At1g10270-like isoform X2 [Hibiscus syriacus]